MRQEMDAALDALAAEADDLTALLAAAPAAAWQQPTRLPGWDVTTLVAHLARGLGRIAAYAATPLDEPARRDRVSYFRYDAAGMAGDVTARAREAARGATPASLTAALRDAVPAARAAVAGLAPTTVIPSAIAPIMLVEYLPTRLLEACVHGLDLRQALGAPPVPTPGVLASTVATLEGLLAAPRPAGLADDVAFVEAAAGRQPYPDPRFPLVA
ncbi:MAG TPA: maleylpyruvate isomerase N-terminal domain-containing protein [Chloroflexota bacterium]|nr:maleylpyruvate isomerase N-terminal domain-containing protein [Chloroflexota bacterium]